MGIVFHFKSWSVAAIMLLPVLFTSNYRLWPRNIFLLVCWQVFSHTKTDCTFFSPFLIGIIEQYILSFFILIVIQMLTSVEDQVTILVSICRWNSENSASVLIRSIWKKDWLIHVRNLLWKVLIILNQSITPFGIMPYEWKRKENWS